MIKLTSILPTVLFATFAPKIEAADTWTGRYFTGYQNDDCTGDEVGTFPATSGDKRFEEVKLKSKPTALTDCNKATFRAGTSSTKDHWVKMQCPTGSDTKVKISTYKGNEGSCTEEDNMMGYYMIDATEVTNLLAGKCAKAKRTATWGDTNEERPDTVSVKWTGFTGSDADLLSGTCGGTATKPAAGPAASSGSSPAEKVTKSDPVEKTKTTAGPTDSSKSGLPHSFFAAPLAIFVGAAVA